MYHEAYNSSGRTSSKKRCYWKATTHLDAYNMPSWCLHHTHWQLTGRTRSSDRISVSEHGLKELSSSWMYMSGGSSLQVGNVGFKCTISHKYQNPNVVLIPQGYFSIYGHGCPIAKANDTLFNLNTNKYGLSFLKFNIAKTQQ